MPGRISNIPVYQSRSRSSRPHCRNAASRQQRNLRDRSSDSSWTAKNFSRQHKTEINKGFLNKSNIDFGLHKPLPRAKIIFCDESKSAEDFNYVNRQNKNNQCNRILSNGQQQRQNNVATRISRPPNMSPTGNPYFNTQIKREILETTPRKTNTKQSTAIPVCSSLPTRVEQRRRKTKCSGIPTLCAMNSNYSQRSATKIEGLRHSHEHLDVRSRKHCSQDHLATSLSRPNRSENLTPFKKDFSNHIAKNEDEVMKNVNRKYGFVNRRSLDCSKRMDLKSRKDNQEGKQTTYSSSADRQLKIKHSPVMKRSYSFESQGSKLFSHLCRKDSSLRVLIKSDPYLPSLIQRGSSSTNTQTKNINGNKQISKEKRDALCTSSISSCLNNTPSGRCYRESQYRECSKISTSNETNTNIRGYNTLATIYCQQRDTDSTGNCSGFQCAKNNNYSEASSGKNRDVADRISPCLNSNARRVESTAHQVALDKLVSETCNNTVHSGHMISLSGVGENQTSAINGEESKYYTNYTLSQNLDKLVQEKVSNVDLMIQNTKLNSVINRIDSQPTLNHSGMHDEETGRRAKPIKQRVSECFSSDSSSKGSMSVEFSDGESLYCSLYNHTPSSTAVDTSMSLVSQSDNDNTSQDSLPMSKCNSLQHLLDNDTLYPAEKSFRHNSLNFNRRTHRKKAEYCRENVSMEGWSSNSCRSDQDKEYIESRQHVGIKTGALPLDEQHTRNSTHYSDDETTICPRKFQHNDCHIEYINDTQLNSDFLQKYGLSVADNLSLTHSSFRQALVHSNDRRRSSETTSCSDTVPSKKKSQMSVSLGVRSLRKLEQLIRKKRQFHKFSTESLQHRQASLTIDDFIASLYKNTGQSDQNSTCLATGGASSRGPLEHRDHLLAAASINSEMIAAANHNSTEQLHATACHHRSVSLPKSFLTDRYGISTTRTALSSGLFPWRRNENQKVSGRLQCQHAEDHVSGNSPLHNHDEKVEAERSNSSLSRLRHRLKWCSSPQLPVARRRNSLRNRRQRTRSSYLNESIAMSGARSHAAAAVSITQRPHRCVGMSSPVSSDAEDNSRPSSMTADGASRSTCLPAAAAAVNGVGSLSSACSWRSDDVQESSQHTGDVFSARFGHNDVTAATVYHHTVDSCSPRHGRRASGSVEAADAHQRQQQCGVSVREKRSLSDAGGSTLIEDFKAGLTGSGGGGGRSRSVSVQRRYSDVGALSAVARRTPVVSLPATLEEPASCEAGETPCASRSPSESPVVPLPLQHDKVTRQPMPVSRLRRCLSDPAISGDRLACSSALPVAAPSLCLCSRAVAGCRGASSIVTAGSDADETLSDAESDAVVRVSRVRTRRTQQRVCMASSSRTADTVSSSAGGGLLAEALWDHVTLSDDELSFRAGDVLRVLARADKHWWFGERVHVDGELEEGGDSGRRHCAHSGRGWFMAAFVRLRVCHTDWTERMMDRSSERVGAASEGDGCDDVVADRAATDPERALNLVDQVRCKVVLEILHSERSFVQDLEHVVEGYLRQVLRRTDLFSASQIVTLFGNIESLYRFQRSFLGALETLVNRRRPHASCLGRLFVEQQPHFAIYADYCNNHPTAVALLQRMYADRRYRQFFEACRLLQSGSGGGGGGGEIALDGYLLTPIQKICKYPLQLAELLKCTPTSHDDRRPVQCAHAAMRQAAVRVNEAKRRVECLEQLAVWQRSVDGWSGPDLLDTSSELIHHSEVTKLTSNSWSREPCVLFLFDHLLVYCRKDLLKRHVMQFRGRIDLDRCQVVDVPAGRDELSRAHVKHAIRVYCSDKNKWYIFSCKSEEDKVRWLLKFREERVRATRGTDANAPTMEKFREIARTSARNHCRPKKPKGTWFSFSYKKSSLASVVPMLSG